ncbi:MAG: UDP-N-acetylmuramate--L-alanine ligase, partial [Thioalkalivibrio sp.]|nr:UDP-N-acetylmuramate--L-alanine ligase [Thioalkalivibrio sp.]
RFTRTRDLFEDFAEVLSSPDGLVLLDIYRAGEPPIPSADGRSLARAIRLRGRVEPVFVESVEDVPEVLQGLLSSDDVVITQGAGDIGQLAARLPLVLRGEAAC